MTESNFSFTTKVDGDLLTARGDTAEEFIHNLASLIGPVIEQVKAVQAEARGISGTAAAVGTVQATIPAAVTHSVPLTATSFSGQISQAAAPVQQQTAAPQGEIVGKFGEIFHTSAPSTVRIGAGTPFEAPGVLQTIKKKDGDTTQRWVHPAEVPGYAGPRPSWDELKQMRQWAN